MRNDSDTKIAAGFIDSSLDGILAFDRRFRFTLWNLKMNEISGISKESVIGKIVFDVFPFLKATGEEEYFLAALNGRTVTVKKQSFSIDETGRQGLFEYRYSPLQDESGEIMGGIAVIKDITKREQEEKKLRVSEERFLQLVHRIDNITSSIGKIEYPDADILSYDT